MVLVEMLKFWVRSSQQLNKIWCKKAKGESFATRVHLVFLKSDIDKLDMAKLYLN